MELSPLTGYHPIRYGCVVTLQSGNFTVQPVKTLSVDWRKILMYYLHRNTMGIVADRIAKKVTSPRMSKVVDMGGYREGREMAIEAGFGDDAPILDSLADLDPCHAVYAFAQNFCSLMAESISVMKEAKGYYRIVSKAEDEYMPVGPPMSPLTLSYFTMWAMFDVRFGSSRETMGSCFLRIMPEFDCPGWLIDAIERMHQSRMGFFVHCGSDGEKTLLREVGTQEILSCVVPAGYVGDEGEVWFVRVLPPPNSLYHQLYPHHLVFNTPYVFLDQPEILFIDYLERELARMMAGKRRLRTDDPHGHLMKYGPEPNHWNEYIFSAYSNHRTEVIFMVGIPDIPETLPHA